MDKKYNPFIGCISYKPIQLDVCNFLEENKYKVVMSLLDVDLYSIGAPFFKDISKRASFYIGFGNNAFRTNDTRLNLEPFIQKKLNPIILLVKIILIL